MNINHSIATLFLTVAFCYPALSQTSNESLVVTGTVEITSRSTTLNSRTRGAAYRNRMTGKQSPSDSKVSNPLEDVVVFLTPLSFEPDLIPITPNPILNQKDITFSPRVLPITVGTTVKIINQDKLYHNVFSLSPIQQFNIGRRPTGVEYFQTFNRSGNLQLFCNIHSNMSSHVLVLKTPYFTKVLEDGSFRVENLPAGDYEVSSFHPDFQSTAQIIKLSATKPNTLKLILN